jgi:hypothetical protein
LIPNTIKIKINDDVLSAKELMQKL